jgi:hypothetical protein
MFEGVRGLLEEGQEVEIAVFFDDTVHKIEQKIGLRQVVVAQTVFQTDINTI